MPRPRRGPAPNVQAPQGPGLADVPTGLPYGEHAALANQVRQGGPPAAPTGPPAAPGGVPASAGDPNVVSQAQSYIPPAASKIGLFRPSDRPDEHVMTGVGAGPGADTTSSLGAMLSDLGRTSPAVAQLAAYVQGGKA